MYRVANVGRNEKFSALEDARKAMLEWGYVPLNMSSCDGSREYWVDVNELPGDATTIDELPATDAEGTFFIFMIALGRATLLTTTWPIALCATLSGTPAMA